MYEVLVICETQVIFSKTNFGKLILNIAIFFALRKATKFGKQYWLGNTKSIGFQLLEEKMN